MPMCSSFFSKYMLRSIHINIVLTDFASHKIASMFLQKVSVLEPGVIYIHLTIIFV